MKKRQFMIISSLMLVSLGAKGQVTQATNAVTTGSYVGTSNAEPLVFKQGNVFSGIISSGTFTNTSFGFNVGNGGAYNVSIGKNAGSNDAGGNNAGNVSIGQNAGRNSINSDNVFVGTSSGKDNTLGAGNVFVGSGSGSKNTTGTGNNAIGGSSLMSNTEGTANFSVGRSLMKNTTGSNNIAIALWALDSNITGNSNIAIGTSAGKQSQGNNNMFFGEAAGGNIKSGNSNIILGFQASSRTYTSSTPVYNNVIIGTNAGYDVSGSNNILIGASSGDGLLTGINNVFLGTVGIGIPVLPTPATSSRTGSDTSNTIILADGAGNQRLLLDGFNSINGVSYNGFAGIGLGNNVRPQNRLEIGTGIANTSGLRFRGINSSSTPVESNGRVLTVNSVGDVVLTTDQGSGGTTLINAGTNVTVAGNGSAATPYVISATGGADTSIYNDNGSINPANTISGNREVTLNNSNIWFKTSSANANDKIYIGETPAFPTATGNYKLYVEGGVLTEKVKVALRNTTNWADYVFVKDYKLTPLKEVAKFIDANQHLPGVASATELVKNGLDLGAMQATQMAKIEELTLYAIEQDKNLDKQAKEIEELKAQVKSLIEKNK